MHDAVRARSSSRADLREHVRERAGRRAGRLREVVRESSPRRRSIARNGISSCVVADLEHAHDVRRVERRATRTSRRNRCDVLRIAELAGREQLDGGARAGRRCDSPRRPRPCRRGRSRSEPERADHVIGEPPRAADLERAIEILARLGEQCLALRRERHRLLHLDDRVARRLVRAAAEQERAEEAALQETWPTASTPGARSRTDEARIVDDTGDHQRRERRLHDRVREVERERGAQVSRAGEEVERRGQGTAGPPRGSRRTAPPRRFPEPTENASTRIMFSLNPRPVAMRRSTTSRPRGQTRSSRRTRCAEAGSRRRTAASAGAASQEPPDADHECRASRPLPRAGSRSRSARRRAGPGLLPSAAARRACTAAGNACAVGGSAPPDATGSLRHVAHRPIIAASRRERGGGTSS